MTSHPFPQIRTRLELDAAPPNRWVECASCLESKSLDEGADPLEWPDEHVEKRPGHTKYRTVSQVNFRVTPAPPLTDSDAGGYPDESFPARP